MAQESTLIQEILAKTQGELCDNFVQAPIRFQDGSSGTFLAWYGGTTVQLALRLADTVSLYPIQSVGRDEQIVSAAFKADNPKFFFALTRSGKVMEFRFDDVTGSYSFALTHNDLSDEGGSGPKTFKDLTGDALYAILNGRVYVSRDTGATWQIDTAGIRTVAASDIDIDTSMNAWCATTGGIFTQHRDSMIWHKNATFPTVDQNCQSIGIDRIGRIFVGTTISIYVSTDMGLTWDEVSSGMNGIPTSFGDDAFGNVYATTYSGAYRLSQLTQMWQAIHNPVTALGYVASTDNLMTAVRGDTLIFAATKYGLLQSSDAGSSWQPPPDLPQIKPYRSFDIARPGNQYLISTGFGIYRFGDGDTAVTKVFPATGYLSGLVMQTDVSGNVYTIAPQAVSQVIAGYYNFISSDGGITWVPDTAGLSDLPINLQSSRYFVDRQGNQYAASGSLLCVKRAGDEWEVDTTGLGIGGMNAITWVTTNPAGGYVYAMKSSVFGNDAMYRRTPADSVWQPLPMTGLAAAGTKIVSDDEGNVIALAAVGGLYRFDGASWNTLPQPTTLTGDIRPDQIEVDRNGSIWVSFYRQDIFNQVFRGLFVLEKNAGTWKYAGLDSIGIRALVAVEDTLFALCTLDGIHAFQASTISTVSKLPAGVPGIMSLDQNYPNPFNPITTIRFSLARTGHVSLNVFNLLGQEVASLIDDVRHAGNNSVAFDAGMLPSGVYFYRLQAEGSVEMRKLTVIK